MQTLRSELSHFSSLAIETTHSVLFFRWQVTKMCTLPIKKKKRHYSTSTAKIECLKLEHEQKQKRLLLLLWRDLKAIAYLY